MISITQEVQSLLLRYFPRGVICLDLETTGLSPMTHEILEIAAVKWLPPFNSPLHLFQTLLKPRFPVPKGVTAIHGITDDCVATAPTFAQMTEPLLAFLEDLPLVAHNAEFDFGFLSFHLQKVGKSFPQNPTYCSLKLSRQALAPQASFKLEKLAAYFNIPHFHAHRAQSDAEVCLQVLNYCLAKSPNLEKAKTRPFGPKSGQQFAQLPQVLANSSDALPCIVEFNYRGGSVKGARGVYAVGFIPDYQNPLLHGMCLVSGKYKNFNVNKIVNFKITPHHSQWQKKYEYWINCEKKY